MQIAFEKKLSDFAQRHPNSKPGLERWRELIAQANFNSIVAVREVFPHADMAKKNVSTPSGQPARQQIYTVFNIGGNKARLVTIIHYKRQQVIIYKVFTHAEYESWLKRRR